VVGGGIAGSLVAWRLLARGYEVTLTDDARPGRASAAAAGLIDPLSGPRLALADRVQTLLPVARELYTQLEREAGRKLFHPMPIVRELSTDDAWSVWRDRLAEPEFKAFVDVRSSEERREGWVTGGGWLDFSAVLAAVRGFAIDAVQETVRSADLERDADSVRWRGREWDVVVFCTGYARDLPENCDLDWRAAAGDSVTIALGGGDESCARVRGIYRIPLGAKRFRVGSTYFWDDLSTELVPERADELLAAVRQLHGEEPKLLDHTVGIRPIFRNRKPLVGPLPGERNAFVANGYGSKGSLWAPWAAEHMAALIDGEISPDPELAPKASGKPVRLTELAHAWIRPFAVQGKFAIDATAGNGHDTAFLAECLGETGRVLAFDLQELAIANTRRRLVGAGLADRVQLHRGSHGEIESWLPEEARGRVSAVMMNLGFLPGSDHAVLTTPEETLRFLEGVLPFMADRAAISVLCYRGHEGGMEEHAAVSEWMREAGIRRLGPSATLPRPQDERTRQARLQRRAGGGAGSPELFFLWR